MPTKVTFSDEEQDDSPSLNQSNITKFMSILGSLIFLLKSRPDISYSVNRMATRSSKATEKDMTALIRILRYIKGSLHKGVTFMPRDDKTVAKLMCWVDAAYATHVDGKSHTGYCFSMGDHQTGMFYAKSNKQTNVGTSSTQAEVVALSEATKEIMWFRLLLEELGYPQLEPTTVYEDNMSAITLTTEFSGNHKKVKHFIQNIHFILEQYNQQVIELVHISSEDQIADILTKPLGENQFKYLCDKLLGYSDAKPGPDTAQTSCIEDV